MSDAPRFLYPGWPAPAHVHAVTTTRRGGASTGAYRSFNLAAHVGDAPPHVKENRRRLARTLALPSAPVWLQQEHGTRVVDAATASAGTVADGAYTDRAGVVCAVLTADCLPIFICDQSGAEIALLHAGWRGLCAGIVEAGVAKFRAQPDALLVWLGPAISARAYQVGNDVRDAFAGRDPGASEAFAPAAEAAKWYMDLYRLARRRLQACGVRSIDGGEYCTGTQADLFYSYRRDGATGRMASLLWRE